MHRNFAVLAALVLGLSITPGTLVAPRSAQAVTVSVSPADTTVDIGNSVTLRIVTAAFPNLKAYRLLLGFNPAVLQFTGATAGDVLTGTGNPFSVQVVPDVSAPTDTAHVDCAQLVGTTSGPGVLVYFAFTALAPGESPIVCDGADFRDPFNVQTPPGCDPGIVRVVSPTPAMPMSWGGVKAIYR